MDNKADLPTERNQMGISYNRKRNKENNNGFK